MSRHVLQYEATTSGRKQLSTHELAFEMSEQSSFTFSFFTSRTKETTWTQTAEIRTVSLIDLAMTIIQAFTLERIRSQ
jgi:hypothetical protein